GETVPIPLADQQGRLGKLIRLADVIGMEVADADELHLLGRDLQLREQIRGADLGSNGTSSRRLSRVPHHIVVAVLDEIAAVDELELDARVGIRAGEARVELYRRNRSATVDPGERDLRGLGAGRQAGASTCADEERQDQQGMSHFSAPSTDLLEAR